MKVVHLCFTPVAGSPIRIVNALNEWTDCQARHITLLPEAYGQRTFQTDLIWESDKEECLAVLAAADIVHLHQYYDIAAAFGPEVAALCCHKVCVRQFHSIPTHFAPAGSVALKNILEEPIPQLVIAQYPAPFYPHARIVPNIVEIPLLESGQAHTMSSLPHIVFSPSNDSSAWSARWGTKGAPEVSSVLHHFADRGLCTVDIIQNVSHTECMQRKHAADIIIDDLVTGSYHLSGLEGLALGKAVFGWIDNSIQQMLYQVTGANWLPWINTHLEDFPLVLEKLLADKDLIKKLGESSRQWVKGWYSPHIFANKYIAAYEEAIEYPRGYQRATPQESVREYFSVHLPELLWQAKKERSRGCTAG